MQISENHKRCHNRYLCKDKRIRGLIPKIKLIIILLITAFYNGFLDEYLFYNPVVPKSQGLSHFRWCMHYLTWLFLIYFFATLFLKMIYFYPKVSSIIFLLTIYSSSSEALECYQGVNDNYSVSLN